MQFNKKLLLILIFGLFSTSQADDHTRIKRQSPFTFGMQLLGRIRKNVDQAIGGIFGFSNNAHPQSRDIVSLNQNIRPIEAFKPPPPVFPHFKFQDEEHSNFAVHHGSAEHQNSFILEQSPQFDSDLNSVQQTPHLLTHDNGFKPSSFFNLPDGSDNSFKPNFNSIDSPTQPPQTYFKTRNPSIKPKIPSNINIYSFVSPKSKHQRPIKTTSSTRKLDSKVRFPQTLVFTTARPIYKTIYEPLRENTLPVTHKKKVNLQISSAKKDKENYKSTSSVSSKNFSLSKLLEQKRNIITTKHPNSKLIEDTNENNINEVKTYHNKRKIKKPKPSLINRPTFEKENSNFSHGLKNNNFTTSSNRKNIIVNKNKSHSRKPQFPKHKKSLPKLKLPLNDESHIVEPITTIKKRPSVVPPRPALIDRSSVPESNPPRSTRNVQSSINTGIKRKIELVKGDNEDAKGYEFGYGVQDDNGNRFFHAEQKSGRATHGSYSIQLPDGRIQTVSYVADENGYQPKISYEGEAVYDSPA